MSPSVQDKDRGIYFCRASNAHLFRAVSSRKVYLNVLGMLPHQLRSRDLIKKLGHPEWAASFLMFPKAPPSVDIWPVVVTAALGSEVRFQCQVSGNPIPSITWSKQGWSMFTGGKVTIGWVVHLYVIRSRVMLLHKYRAALNISQQLTQRSYVTM